MSTSPLNLSAPNFSGTPVASSNSIIELKGEIEAVRQDCLEKAKDLQVLPDRQLFEREVNQLLNTLERNITYLLSLNTSIAEIIKNTRASLGESRMQLATSFIWYQTEKARFNAQSKQLDCSLNRVDSSNRFNKFESLIVDSGCRSRLIELDAHGSNARQLWWSKLTEQLPPGKKEEFATRLSALNQKLYRDLADVYASSATPHAASEKRQATIWEYNDTVHKIYDGLLPR